MDVEVHWIGVLAFRASRQQYFPCGSLKTAGPAVSHRAHGTIPVCSTKMYKNRITHNGVPLFPLRSFTASRSLTRCTSSASSVIVSPPQVLQGGRARQCVRVRAVGPRFRCTNSYVVNSFSPITYISISMFRHEITKISKCRHIFYHA